MTISLPHSCSGFSVVLLSLQFSGRKLDRTTITTIKLARAYNKIKSKLKPRARVLNNKEIFIKIDSKLKNKTDEQIYQAVFKALQRT